MRRFTVSGACGVAIAAALFWLRGFGPRIVARSKTGKGWSAVFGRAVERTHSFFIVMLSAKLVVGYAGAPADVSSTVTFLFTIAAVFQAAIWAREIILGAIEHRTRGEHIGGEALGSAMGLIRLLVSFSVFAKSASVSPGKPTMKSEEIEMPGRTARSLRIFCLNSSAV